MRHNAGEMISDILLLFEADSLTKNRHVFYSKVMTCRYCELKMKMFVGAILQEIENVAQDLDLTVELRHKKINISNSRVC